MLLTETKSRNAYTLQDLQLVVRWVVMSWKRRNNTVAKPANICRVSRFEATCQTPRCGRKPLSISTVRLSSMPTTKLQQVIWHQQSCIATVKLLSANWPVTSLKKHLRDSGHISLHFWQMRANSITAGRTERVFAPILIT
ncbi:hypothetical protein [Hafnia psychrotolerans]|uniref:hypothetical protein n=1 Tax=Hafnia psychrotolerans TaxID=1477018 RepID=UPI00166E9007|nr:hypothetical protein [Hafnia psychrotolerans]